MKAYKVMLSETALSHLRFLDHDTRERVKQHLRELGRDPFSRRPKADIKILHGSRNPALYRLRIGSYRAIFAVKGEQVMVTEIVHRSRGYKWLE